MTIRAETVAAFVELQLSHITPPGAPLLDDPQEITREIQSYLEAVQDSVRALFGFVLGQIDLRAQAQGKPFHQLDLGGRERVLQNLWDDPVLHDLVSLVARLGWLVTYSRTPARARIGFTLPDGHPRPEVRQPERPPLDQKYDVCVVGSGAGGALVAARLAEKQKNVLLVDDGPWMSPASLDGRDDRALPQMYRNAAVQPALPRLDAVLRPGGFAFINVLQARVFGGGPMVNNAIHLPISQERWEYWHDKLDFPVEWADLEKALGRVRGELGITPKAARGSRGWRTSAFVEGARRLGLGVDDLDLSIVEECIGCGGCNVGCSFGLRTGGLHGDQKSGPPSYLERAMRAGAKLAPQVRGLHFKTRLFGRSVRTLEARDLTRGKDVSIAADRFVLAAGPIASSKILLRSVFQVLSPVGQRISANVVMPVFALLDPAIPKPDPKPKEPGLQMCCVYVDPEGRLLESWFHYPASLAIALPEWLEPHAEIMLQYQHLTACSVVVPTENRGAIGPHGELVLSLSDAELRRMVEGVVSLADVFFQAGALKVFPASRLPLYIRRERRDEDVRTFRQSIRGPADLALSTAHPQGGNALGRQTLRSVVSPGFSLYDFSNLFVADASLFPAGCNVNPQMTAMALASLAADRLIAAG